uniref:Poly [ADP-ribose] polymerase n=1 Tax=Nothobranchius furzeri TaxID=105023 RepID=A0A1A8B2Y3_NOTFU
MNAYQYPLFFEARDLTDREKRKIWRHFQRRRDSGGGECSVIEKVEDDVYKVSFQESQDQQRVLQRKTHTISLPGGVLRLTIRETSLSQVYKESDYAVVVVGETEAVKEKIAILEKFLPIQKELPVVERKFKLVEDEFKQEMSTRYPDVKVSRAVPPDLTRVKEMLQKAKNEANRGEFRVDVRFISSSSGTPTTQVQLVGYTEQVNKLKDLLHDYQTNQILTQEVINLQFPEMVDYFDKILKMVGMKQTKVILKVSHFPNPFVLLSGPLHLVKETQQALSSALASLTLDTLVLDGPGAQRYFQGDGKVSKELVESSFLVLIWQQDVYSKFGTINQGSINRPSSCTPRSHFNALGEMNKMNLEIKICSLEDEQVNVLVAPMLNQQLASTNIGTSLLHVRGENDAGAVEQLVCDIIKCCEDNGFTSVAMPAIRAGAGGMDPVVVAGAILRGIKVGTSSTILHRLATIRLVLRNMDLFLTFKHQAMQMFSPLTQVSQQLPRVQQSPVSGILNTSIAGQQSAFQFLGLSRKNVDDAMERFSELYDTQCSNHNFNKEDLMDLTTEDVLGLQQLVESEGLCVQLDPSGNLTVSGLKDGVSKMVMLMHDIFMRTKEENNLYTRVAWCIMGQNGNWERLPKTSNYKLEKQDIKGGIQDARGVLWQVDLKERKGTSHALGQSILKRVEHLDDFTFPLYWDSMAPGEVMKVVTLQPHSQEYKTVERDFKQTAHKKIRKIERLQNIHLRRAYEAQKKQLSDKNKNQGGEGEKLLYHGTTRESSDSIMKTGFNRRFAGQNATAYGKGTYFAVKASYSASTTYSRPAADGFQRMFLAKVLTGMFTQGQQGMKVPPPLDDRQPSSRYDSVVDNISSPGMFIVFHDDQAYPDYLITFN